MLSVFFLQKLNEKSAEKRSACSMLLDPMLNGMLSRMEQEIRNLRTQLDAAQSALHATGSSPDVAQVRRLVARCRKLLAENARLGERLSVSNKSAALANVCSVQSQIEAQFSTAQREYESLLRSAENELELQTGVVLALKVDLECERRRTSRLIELLESKGMSREEINEALESVR